MYMYIYVFQLPMCGLEIRFSDFPSQPLNAKKQSTAGIGTKVVERHKAFRKHHQSELCISRWLKHCALHCAHSHPSNQCTTKCTELIKHYKMNVQFQKETLSGKLISWVALRLGILAQQSLKEKG